ncbi:hypothetical protein D3C76_1828380 [compost metagenome]
MGYQRSEYSDDNPETAPQFQPRQPIVQAQQAFVVDHHDDDDHQCIDQRDGQHGEPPAIADAWRSAISGVDKTGASG